MKNLVLPFKFPFTTTIPLDANAVSIISSDERAYPWLYNNFIQLIRSDENSIIYFFDFHYKNSPVLKINRIDKNILNFKNNDEIISFCKRALNNKNYIYLKVNAKFISTYGVDYDSYHDMMIYGYDDINCVFNIADNFFINGKYAYSTCKYIELINAVINADKKSEMYRGVSNYIEMIEYETYDAIKINLSRIKESISDYLNCIPTKFWFTKQLDWNNSMQNRKFGIECYNSMYDIIEKIIHDKSYTHIGKLSICIMYDHKYIMLKRFQYLNDNKLIDDSRELINEYNEILNFSSICKNMFIKYTMTRDEIIARKIIDKYKVLCDKEYTILSKSLGKF